jgi:hypothetical protein
MPLKIYLLVVAAAADSDVLMDDEKEVESRAVESQLVDACLDHADLLTGHLIDLFHQLCVLNMRDFRYSVRFRLRDSLNVPLEEKTFLKISVNFWGNFKLKRGVGSKIKFWEGEKVKLSM